MAVTIQSRPDKVGPVGQTSRWLALNADYPVNFTFKREDFQVTAIKVAQGKYQPTVGQDITAFLNEGDKIFVSSVLYGNLVLTIEAFAFAGGETLIRCEELVPGTQTQDNGPGLYMNLLTARNTHRVQIDIYDGETSQRLTTALYRGLQDGTIKFDCTQWLRSYFTHTINNTLPVLNEAVPERTKAFFLKWTEIYTGSTEVEQTDVYLYTGISGAKQLLDEYGANIAEYVCFNVFSTLPKFLSAFEKPRYFPGYPFRLAFIIETGGASPTFSRYEQGFTELQQSTGVTDTSIVGADLSKLQHLVLAGGYADNVCELDVWLDSSLTPINSCSLLNSGDWSYGSWGLDSLQRILYIPVVPNAPVSEIASVDSYPNGQLLDGATLIDTLVYDAGANGGAGAYVPQSGAGVVTLAGAYTASIADIPVTTRAGESCTLSFSQLFVGENVAPVASAITFQNLINGTPRVGSTLITIFTYTDADGDLPDTASHNYRLNTYTNDTGTLGETEVRNGVAPADQYPLTAADAGLYLRPYVAPVALAGLLNGAEQLGSIIGPVLISWQFFTSWEPGVDADFAPTTQMSEVGLVSYWVWPDTTETIATQPLLTSGTPSGFDGTTRAVIVWSPGYDKLTTITLNTVQLESSFDASLFPNLVQLEIRDNPSFSGPVTVASQTFTTVLLDNNNISGTLTFATATINGVFYANDNPGLNQINFQAGNTYTFLRLQGTALNGALDFSTATASHLDMAVNGLTLVTSLLLPPGEYKTLTGDGMTGITSIDLSVCIPTSSGGVKDLMFRGCSNLATITWPLSSTRNWRRLYFDACAISGTVDLSGLGAMPTEILLNDNTGLAQLDLPNGATTNALKILWVHNNTAPIVNNIDTSPGISSVNNAYYYFHNCAYSSAQVDAIIIAVAATSVSGFTGRRLWLNAGTNGAPTAASATELAQLVSDGWQVQTN